MATAPGAPDRESPDAGASTHRDLIVVGASAGGVDALQHLAADLPPDLPASVLVVLHMLKSGPSYLHDILARSTQLTVTRARDGEQLERGHVYVAPPGSHMLLRGNSILLDEGEPENGYKPSIDKLFRSAARSHRSRAVGVVLTGTLDDGAKGLGVLKEHGGTIVVQDPGDASFGDMPRNAIGHVEPDRIAPLAELGDVLCELLGVPHPSHETSRPKTVPSTPHPAREPQQEAAPMLTCPACGGVLVEKGGDSAIGFGCQTGHAYTLEDLVEQGSALESTLLQAMHVLEDRAELLRRIAGQPTSSTAVKAPSNLEERAASVAGHADFIRGTILRLHGDDGENATEAKR